MEPEKFGRTLGIGVRVASKIARDRAARAANGKTQASPLPGRPIETVARAASRATQQTRAVTHGTKRFGQAFFGPLRHAGSVLWLEVTGLFFALFAVYFAQSAYRIHQGWRQGAEHTHFILYAVLTILFGWFSASSFVRARRKQRKAR